MDANHIPVAEAATMLPEPVRRAQKGESIPLSDGPDISVALHVMPLADQGLTVQQRMEKLREIEAARGHAMVPDDQFADDLERVGDARFVRSGDPWTDF